jgi:hypothetical protein
MRYILTLLLVMFPILIANMAVADSGDKCSGVEKVVKQESTLATASFFANERDQAGSIRYESGAMLEKAESNVGTAQKPADLCPAGCQISEKPEVIFKAVPNKFLSDYSDYDKCQKLLEETEKTPFSYTEHFSSIDQIESWFSDFSRGKGEDGKDMYNKCSGKCSPQYELIISKEGSKLTLNAEVICGHERDKKDNQYELSYSYRWSCESK